MLENCRRKEHRNRKAALILGRNRAVAARWNSLDPQLSSQDVSIVRKSCSSHVVARIEASTATGATQGELQRTHHPQSKPGDARSTIDQHHTASENLAQPLCSVQTQRRHRSTFKAETTRSDSCKTKDHEQQTNAPPHTPSLRTNLLSHGPRSLFLHPPSPSHLHSPPSSFGQSFLSTYSQILSA